MISLVIASVAPIVVTDQQWMSIASIRAHAADHRSHGSSMFGHRQTPE